MGRQARPDALGVLARVGASAGSEPIQPQVPGSDCHLAADAALADQSARAPHCSEPTMNRGTGVARYESLDAWRGVACLMVILYHSTMMYRGHLAGAPAGVLETFASWVVTAT